MSDVLKLHVLVVEDDPDTRDNLCDILSLDGHAFDTAASAAAALARENWADYQVILLDWRLPDATAETLLPTLRRLAPSAAVIVSTAVGGIDQAIVALRHGAVDYIAKPVDADLLRASLRRVGEQRRLMLEKARADAAFRSLVESAGSVIVILNPDGAIAYMNPFAEQLTGYSCEEVIHHNCVARLVPADYRERVAQHLSQALAGHPERGSEWPICSRSGELRWVLWNIQYLDDLGGGPAVLAIGQDVTARKQAEDKLLQAERLAAIGQAMTGLAHESRNALQRGQADLELLALLVEDRSEAMSLVHRLQRVQHDLHRLYEEVRQYAAPLNLTVETHDLGHIAREAWELLDHARTGRDATIEFLGEPDRRCRVDRFQVLQTFRNILENSLAATHDPVRITVGFRDELDVGRHWLVVSVRDNGPGFPPGLGDAVFNAFVTTNTRGTGLGLAIVRRIIEAHRGRAQAGRPERGAEIILTLPR